jgi:hypothetical protein
MAEALIVNCDRKIVLQSIQLGINQNEDLREGGEEGEKGREERNLEETCRQSRGKKEKEKGDKEKVEKGEKDKNIFVSYQGVAVVDVGWHNDSFETG